MIYVMYQYEGKYIAEGEVEAVPRRGDIIDFGGVRNYPTLQVRDVLWRMTTSAPQNYPSKEVVLLLERAPVEAGES